MTLSRLKSPPAEILLQFESDMVECTTTGGRPSLADTEAQGSARGRGRMGAGRPGSRWTQEWERMESTVWASRSEDTLHSRELSNRGSSLSARGHGKGRKQLNILHLSLFFNWSGVFRNNSNSVTKLIQGSK